MYLKESMQKKKNDNSSSLVPITTEKVSDKANDIEE